MIKREWTPAYVGLGSNLDDPRRQIEHAFAALSSLADSMLVCRSRLYRSAPLGPQNQPDFINAVAGLLTRQPARSLFAALKDLERRLGRTQPIERWGPRRIDLDLLLYGSLAMNDDDLILPHPGLTERNFVLAPLADIAPALIVPHHGRVSDLASLAGMRKLEPLEGSHAKTGPDP